MEEIDVLKHILNATLDYFGIKPTVSVEKDADGVFGVQIDGDSLNFLIGYRGETLDALQSLVSLMFFKKTGSWSTVVVDINNYKKEKKLRLEDITKNYIDRVRFLGKDVELPVMSAFERRLVHVFVSGYEDVVSESTGSGVTRHVVLRPKTV